MTKTRVFIRILGLFIAYVLAANLAGFAQIIPLRKQT